MALPGRWPQRAAVGNRVLVLATRPAWGFFAALQKNTSNYNASANNLHPLASFHRRAALRRARYPHNNFELPVACSGTCSPAARHDAIQACLVTDPVRNYGGPLVCNLLRLALPNRTN